MSHYHTKNHKHSRVDNIHNHGPESPPNGGGKFLKRLWWALAINFIFLIVEFVGGMVSGSLALLADAGHMLTDVAALALAIIAAHLAARPPTPARTFGLLRAEVVGAFINGATLVVIVGFVFWGAWSRLAEPVEVDGPLMLGVAVAGLIANVVSALILMEGRRENLNVEGAFLHMAGDALGSVGAITAGLVIMTTGWYPIDLLVSLLIGIIILWGSLSLLRRSLDIILNATPEGIDYQEVRSALLEINHFEELYDLHIWTVASGYPVLSVHVYLEPGCSDSTHWQQCLREAQDMLRKRFGIVHSTLQLEPTGYLKDNRSI